MKQDLGKEGEGWEGEEGWRGGGGGAGLHEHLILDI